jgi:hypothetical protein
MPIGARLIVSPAALKLKRDVMQLSTRWRRLSRDGERRDNVDPVAPTDAGAPGFEASSWR